MTVVGARIDNRLLHGIVATQWAPQSGASRVMVIDDTVAEDPVLKESMKLGRPSGMAISIISKKTALTNFKAGKYDAQKVFIVSKTPEIYLQLLKQNIQIPEIILGGTVVPEENTALKVSKRAYILEDQFDVYKEILKTGSRIFAKFVPSDKDIDLATLI